MVVMTSNIHKHDRTGVYYFRRAVPTEIREAIGKREWKVSLKTKNIYEARLRHNAEAQKCEEAFAKARAHLSGTVRIFPSDAPILADRWALSVMQEWVNSPDTLMNYVVVEQTKGDLYYEDGSPCEDGEIYTPVFNFSQSVGADKANEKVILSEIKETLASEGIPLPDKNDPSRDALIYAFTQKYRVLCILALDRLNNDWGKTISTEHAYKSLSITANPEVEGTTKLSYVFERWAEDKRLNDGEKNRRVIKTIGEYQTVINRFIQLYDDLPVDEITRDHVNKFRIQLSYMPTHTKGMKGKTAPELIKMAELGDLPKISLNTIKKHLKCLSTILNFACQRLGLIDVEPVSSSGIINRVSKAVLKEAARNPKVKDYTVEELHRIFSSPLYCGNWQPTRHKHRNALFWIPLIMAYSGARREEICQLNVADVVKDKSTGIWCINISPDNIDKNTKHDKARTFPLHEHLLRLGFLDYVSSLNPRGKLFPTLTLHPTDCYGASFGKLWSAYVKDIVKLESDADPSHGFRHAFRTICLSAGIDSLISYMITGHSPADEGGKYGSVTLETAKKALDKFPSFF